MGGRLVGIAVIIGGQQDMSAAFIIAIIFFIGTVCLYVLTLFGYAMSDNPEENHRSAWSVLISGTVVSILIALSHFASLHW